MREGWFTIRVVNPWNSLPTNVVNAPSIATFKERLDEYLEFKHTGKKLYKYSHDDKVFL